MICLDCDYAGRPSYKSPCSECDRIKGSPLCRYEHEEKPTRADHIRSMSDEELARWICGGTIQSNVACKYCEYYKTSFCGEAPCQGVTDAEIIMKWLKQPMED